LAALSILHSKLLASRLSLKFGRCEKDPEDGSSTVHPKLRQNTSSQQGANNRKKN